MRRRLNLLLTLIFLMLVLLCGAGAYFTDQQQASIRAAAASMGLTVSKPSYGTIPKEIEKDSRLTVQFQIRNESSVPVYLSDQHVLYVTRTNDGHSVVWYRRKQWDGSRHECGSSPRCR